MDRITVTDVHKTFQLKPGQFVNVDVEMAGDAVEQGAADVAFVVFDEVEIAR